MKYNEIILKKINISNSNEFVLIAGPCQLENEQHALKMSERLKKLTDELKIPFIFKTSFDKANRLNLHSKRGVGLMKSMPIFDKIQNEIGCPILTDVHEAWQCEEISPVVDIIQIPSFLCRQTDLLIAAGKTGKIVNIKKGEFLTPYDVKFLVEKLETIHCKQILVTERGTSFGYNNLIVDMKTFPILSKTGYPIFCDITHSVQEPGSLIGQSGGNSFFSQIIARAALSLGIAGIYLEVHDNPEIAPCDGAIMLPLKELKKLLKILIEIDNVAKKNPIEQFLCQI